MVSLGQFARNIRTRGKAVEMNTNQLVIRTALAIDQALVLATPVDTGRARANWQVGLFAPITEATENTDKSGGETIAHNTVTIRGRQPEVDIHLTNNLSYIQSLNEGSSSQAPANFVEQAVLIGIGAAKRIKIVK